LVFTVIDSEGYRPNVGIILCNADGRLFWARRIGQHSWQFPQGGIRRDESPEQAMFRELGEEVGLRPEHVQVIGCTNGWLRYRLPKRLVRRGNKPTCIGQKQVWFLLRMVSGEDSVRLDGSDRPEFDHWQWVDYWYPLRAVVPFKRHVYWRALHELAPLLFSCRPPRDTSPARTEDANRTDRPLPVIKPVAVLPLRRTETYHHPVITRMVVSARRGGIIDPLAVVVAPSCEAVAPAATLDKPRPPAPRSRRLLQR
jgi:putative (di)nucleoside polyphosphate hydrolase